MATFRTLLWWFLTIGLYAAWKEFYLTELMRINYKIWSYKGWTQSLKKFISLRRRLLYNAPHLNSHRTKRNNINLRLCGKNGTFSKLYLRIIFFLQMQWRNNRYKSGFPCHIYRDVESVTDAFEGETTKRWTIKFPYIPKLSPFYCLTEAVYY